MPGRITVQKLISLVGTDRCPMIVDVRRSAVFQVASTRIAGAVWRNHMDPQDGLMHLYPRGPLVVYCVHGHNVSEIAAAKLAAAGVEAAVLEGGIEAWIAAGGPVVSRAARDVEPGLPVPSLWVTRERPKIDRIACPWLVRRFFDPFAIFHFVDAVWVKDVAAEMGAIPFDIDDVHYSHQGEQCTFDTMLSEFGLIDPALLRIAQIVRAADTARLDLAPQAAGLLALSLGLSATEGDDLKQLDKGMVIYDALYGWCRHGVGETHNRSVAG
ncbi:sulfurtransferase [Mesorhizobium sp. NBSH29]|uniref:chromate resistance protein ChrB domain-containing protein n=1 Tax=Mesorhizobium sp. NBSH29 TaxID=2654249 RepID=UPI0018967135|nr:chromate resistance protein ChrB domain-containing protein [Mesorhizobium sp. NBSH29]QPC88431.1 sulfurtransferase [Mesorhizobium sp. NBSH29]